MKKILLGILAIAAMTSCMKEQVLSQQAPATIKFANSFVEGVSRAAVDPSTTTQSITAFDVWGFMDKNTGVVFNAERVSRADENSEWAYTNIAYWAPSHHYYFAALSPVDNDKIKLTLADNGNYMTTAGLGTVAFENVDGTCDLLYAEADVITEAKIEAKPAPVKLQFAHLLSKVKFTFTNGFSSEFNTLEVKNIKMVAPAVGTIDLTQDTFLWNVQEGAKTVELLFGDMTDANGASQIAVTKKGECANERLTIPVATTANLESVYDVYFDVVLYQGTEIAYEGTKKTTVKGTTLEAGKKYNFTATLNHKNVGDNALYPIEFEVEVDEWVDGGIFDGGVITTETVKP